VMLVNKAFFSIRMRKEGKELKVPYYANAVATRNDM